MSQNIDARFESSSENFSLNGLGLMSYHSSGGDPDGYIGVIDTSLLSVNYYQASQEFDGHKLKYFKGELSYDIEASGDGKLTGNPDVKIVGRDGITLVAEVGQAGNTWTHESIALDAKGGWHIGSLDGPLATNHDIKAVLKDVSQLDIRADYSAGVLGTSGLDNVKLAHAQKDGHHDIAPQAFTSADAHHALPLELHHVPVSLEAGHLAIA